MDRIALLLKSYGPDRAYARRLIDSFHRHNADQLTLFCVVPRDDVPSFAPLASDTVTVLAEEDVAGAHLVSEGAHGLSAAYLNQEIVKLSFWETEAAANVFCVDSDAVFIRPFGAADFMRDETTPYSVLVQDKDLEVEPRYYREHWRGRAESIRRIMTLVGLDDPIMRTCHGHQVFSSGVLQSFRDVFLAPRGWGYADALRESPYEFSWYNMWLQKARVIPIHAIEPLVKVFHNEDQHLASIVEGVTVDDIARAYIAVVVNSNYSRGLGMVEASGTKSESLAPYLSYGEVASLIGAKARDTWRRRVRRSPGL
jgi:hypothetical protein